jgi:hypothetical protein
MFGIQERFECKSRQFHVASNEHWNAHDIPLYLYLYGYMRDAVYQQNVETRDAVLSRVSGAANDVNGNPSQTSRPAVLMPRGQFEMLMLSSSIKLFT